MAFSLFHFKRATAAVLLTFTVGICGAADKSGREVVEQVCAACHASGKDGAPKIGDVGAWTQHAKQGLGKLTEHAISGVGKMPAHGGQPSLSDLEMSRAVAFMVSFGHAVDPSKPFASPQTVNAEQLVQDHCLACHGPGKDGAPRIDDFDAWRPRLQAGLDPLLRSAMNGHKAMPARSGLSTLSDTDLRNAITFMIVQAASFKAK